MREIRTAALIGMGAMGAVFAPGLSATLGDGFRVVAGGVRKARLARGVMVNGAPVTFRLTEPEGPAEPVDLVILAVKDYAYREALEQVGRFVGEDTILLPVLNGLDCARQAGEVYGPEKVLYASMWVDASMENGTAVYNPRGMVRIGEARNDPPGPRVLALEDLFRRAGVRCRVEPDMIHCIWLKFMGNVSENLPCALLGVQADDLNVSCEVLEMPQKTGFLGLKLTPAKVCVSVEEPDAPAAAPAEPVVEKKTPVQEAVKAAPVAEEPAAAAAQPEAKAEEPAAPAAEAAAERPAAEEEEPEVPIVIEENAKIKAAVDYLREVIALMGVENVTFSAVQKGEATIIRLDGEKLGALIGRRGETMESLSYLASLVANRLEGDYIKLGLDVAGYRDKRESDLTALAQRIGAKVRKTGRSFAMEPMNPYERRIIHSAISKMEGVRSESKGEGRDRRVVIYSTAPDAQTENTYGERRPRGGRPGNGRRPGGNRNGGYRGGSRSEHGDRNGNRGGYRGSRNGGNRGPRPSGVPERTYAPRDAETAAPVAPKRTERVDDFADFSFGKIEL